VTAGGTEDPGRGRKLRGVGEGDRLPGLFGRGTRSPPMSTASLSLGSLPRPGVVLCARLGIVGEPPLPKPLFVGFGEIALGAGTVFLGFEFAICSKCERREDTGFCSILNQHLVRNDMSSREEPTIDEPSKFSSPDSSIVKTNEDKIEVGKIACPWRGCPRIHIEIAADLEKWGGSSRRHRLELGSYRNRYEETRIS
jgi:hypothetical protein